MTENKTHEGPKTEAPQTTAAPAPADQGAAPAAETAGEEENDVLSDHDEDEG